MARRLWSRSLGMGAGIVFNLVASTALAGGVVGNGTLESCTDEALGAALVGGGTVTFNCGDSSPIPITTHVIPAGDTTVVEGYYLHGQFLNRHFEVEPGASLTLRAMNLIGGSAIRGGSILNRGTLVVETSSILESFAIAGGDGGAIFNDTGADLTIIESNFGSNEAEGRGGFLFNRGTASLLRVDSSNRCVGAGGGIANGGGTLNVDLARIIGTCEGSGGAIHQSGGTIDIRRSLIEGSANVDGGSFHQTAGTALFENVSFYNTQAPRGGAIFADGSIALRNTTLYATLADDGGSLFIGPSGAVTAVNTLFAETYRFDGNAGTHCAGTPLTSLGHNLSTDASCNLVGAGDLPSTDPGITSEAGGPWSFVLVPAIGGPAVDAGDDTVCPATDQRDSMSRPQDGGTGTAICDIGAIEVVPEPAWSALVAGGFGLAMMARRSGRRGRS